jgi:hypothetical protein
MRTIEARTVITEHEFKVLMSDVYCENLDMDILESKDEKDKKWFKDVENMIKYLLYQEFDIEVVKEVVE